MNLSKAELLALLAMAFGVFMDGLDSSIINIALPVVAEYFDTDTSSVAWVTVVYFMMIAGLMLTFGRIADSGHIRKIYIAGFALFSVSSLACGLSTSLEMLVAARVSQGIGAAMLGAVAPMICVKFLPIEKLGLSMSILMLAGAVGFGIGPAIGGLIIDIASWQWTFFINVPIGIIAILFALKALPKDHDIKESKLDVMGCTLLFLAVICGVYILEMFSHEDQGLICTLLVIPMLLSLLLFIRTEKRALNPMLNLSIFRDWRFVSAVLCYMLVNVAYVGIAYLVPFYISKELDVSFTFAGFLIMIPSFVTMALSLPAGRYGDLHGRRLLAIICTGSMIAMAVGYWLLNPSMGWLPFVPIGILGGIMWGLCGASVASRIIDLAPDEDKGMASTLSNFLYYTGGSIGTALFASLVTIGSDAIGIPLEDITPEAFLTGFTFTMVFGIMISVIAFVCAFVINEKKITKA